MGNEITQQHLSQLQTQMPLISTAEFLCTTRRMQLKRHTVTKTWRHGGKSQIKLSAGEITIANIKIIIKPVKEATRWVIMTLIIIVGRCLLLPSFWRETEGTDCTWISLPPNYDRGARGNQPLEDEVQHQPRPRWPMNKYYVKPFHMEPHTRMWFLNQCIEIHVLGMAKKEKKFWNFLTSTCGLCRSCLVPACHHQKFHTRRGAALQLHPY